MIAWLRLHVWWRFGTRRAAYLAHMNEVVKGHRLKHEAAGRCAKCGGENDSAPLKKCSRCRASENASKKRYRARLKEAKQ